MEARAFMAQLRAKTQLMTDAARVLRAALDEGERSGVAEDSSLEGVLEEFRSARALA
jgi:hypothetical protein